MPATKVEFDNSHESLNRIFHFGQSKEYFWVCHEAISVNDLLHSFSFLYKLRNSLKHRSRFKDEGR